MDQLSLIQSGCQQWIRQPAAVSSHHSQFAVSSSLAIYVHAQQDFRLVKILAQHNQHLNAICWSPVDSKLLACATSEQVLKVYHLDSEAVLYSCQLPAADAVRKLCWSTRDESVLLAALGNTVGSWPYKAGDWHVLHTFRAAVTCMQQSASEPRLLAVGCADCSLHLYDLLVMKVVCTVKLDDGAVPCDIQFDPLSKQYLLLLCRNGSISMYAVSEDQNVLNHVFSLAKQPAAERSAAFVPNEPGNFLSISNKTGVLQLWNVSQQQPLKSMKTGKGPAQSVQFFPGTSKALLTFQDGTVMVYDVRSQEAEWSTQPGHTETIFDCCFAPHNLRLLATCSFDGSVRVWDVGTGSCVKTLELPGTNSSTSSGVQNQGVALYSVAWCPDGSQLASSSNKGAVYLYDYAKGVAIKKWQLHTKMSLKVAWHPSEPMLLVSSSMDGSVVAFKTDGTKVKVLRHSSGTSGCAWHSCNPYMLATTSEEGPVYVWDVSQPGDSSLLQTLNGHAKRSFSVAWSPLLPHLLLSGSDDATARVWDVQTGMCVALLLGHTLEVRALCWHPEVPWLVFTGSWDSTIRAWDIRSRSCLSVCHHHHGDVYGLSIHAACPWVMASASRDTTVRLWDIKGLAGGLLPRCFLEGLVPCGQAEQHAAHSLPLLCGSASLQLSDWCSRHMKASNASQLSGLTASGRVELFHKLSAYFTAPGPAQTLWQLAAAVAAQLSSQQGSLATSNAGSSAAGSAVMLARCGSSAGGSSGGATRPLPANESFGFQHMTAAKQALTSAANQLELSVRSRGLGKATMGPAKKEEALVEAALLHLQAGAVEHCCDLLLEAGEWDKALALAPAVSHEYWQQLLQRKADAAAKAGASVKELLPLMLASGQTAALMELLMGQKQYGLAAGIAAVHACGGYQHFATATCQQQQPGQLRPHLSIKLEPASPIDAAAVAAISSPTRTGGKPGSLSPLSSAAAPAAAAPQLLGPIESSSLMVRRNSQLPPLKGAPGSASLGPGALHHSVSTGALAAATAAAVASPTTTAAAAAAGPDRSWSLGGASSPGAGEGFGRASSSESPKLGRLASLGLGADSGAAGAAHGLLQAPWGSLARMRSCDSAYGAAVGVPADPVALAQLAKVRSAQALAHRQRGQPLLAACASLTVNDVTAAITALHLGHEPEQAAMIALALGQLAGVELDFLDRVFAALAVKCEAAGDCGAAALAIKLLSTNVEHHLQLLAVRAEHSSNKRDHSGTAAATAASAAETPAGAASMSVGLRQQLGLRDAAYYATRSETASDPLEVVRCLLLAGDHPRAAAKAITHLHPLLQQLQQQAILLPPSSTDHPLQQQAQQQLGQPLGQLQAVQQLLLWQGCLESLDPAALVLPCWHKAFAYMLLAAALRAFGYSYTKVGSFLMSCLRRWLQQHQVTFPLCRAALLMLEAQAMADSSPEAACSLLLAAADGADTPEDIKTAARQKVQGYPRPAAAGSAAALDAGRVVAAGSSLPCRGPASGFCRSVVTGKAFEGPWRVLDDGSSVVSMSEAVILSHVMHIGPCGTGSALQL